MQNVHQEIEDVYDSILKVGFSEKYGDQSELRKKAALETFDSEPSKFKYIARKYLEDTDLYRVYSKPRRSIVGEILKKIVFSNGYGKFGGQKLYDRYTGVNRD